MSDQLPIASVLSDNNGDGTDKKTPFSVVPNSEKEWPAQLCFLALGFKGPEPTIADQLGLNKDQRSNFKADYGKYATNIPALFAAGDCRRGQSLVVWAIHEGREAARECDRYLMGQTGLLSTRRSIEWTRFLTMSSKCVATPTAVA